MNRKIIVKNNRLEEKNTRDFTIEKNKIILKKNGDYIIEYHDSNDIHLEIELKEKILVKLFIYSKDNHIKINNIYKLRNNSNLLLLQFYDNFMTTENTTIYLEGEYSKMYGCFSSISHKNEEYHIIVNHNKKNTESDIIMKSIGLDKSKCIIQIDAYLKKGIKNCIMNQESRVITLGEVDAKIIPNMFIEDNDVEARHGSIIGSFNEEEIFYLTSRGIEREEAILLLIKGFLFSNLMVDYEKRQYIMQSILELRR